MEYVAGRSLKSIVREDGALDPAIAIDIVVQILRAARFAHRRGVIHRDLKPHNVILDEEGRARVTDFGIARAGASDMTLTGSVMGTAQYLSPEQAQGFAVSSASDLYSVGVILYELLTGTVPFEGESAVAVAFKQVSAAPRPPSEINPAIPPSLDAVVLRALAKEPSARYADADELIAALEHERAGLPAYQGAAIAVWNETAATALAEPPPPQTGSMLVVPPMGPPLEQEPSPEDSSRKRAWLWAAALLAVALIAVGVLLLTSSTKDVRVPNVVGDNEQAAIAALRGAGLHANPALAPSVKVPTGLVVSQNPTASSTVPKGSSVRVVVSGGPARLPLPDVHGLRAGEATARLHGAGFKTQLRNRSSSSLPSGVAIGTEPPAHVVTQQGTVVTVLVSSGPALVKVPDIRGESQTVAEAALADAGLELGTVTKESTSSQSPGSVLSQDPSAGTQVQAASKVNLTVAQAPKAKQVSVPTVVGRSELAAEEALERDGLQPVVSTLPAIEASQVGKVLRQSPSGGTQIAKGSNVRIFIGLSSGGSTTPTTTTPTTPSPTPSPTPGP
jgi:serine/threonine-protein kinase